MLTLSAWYYTKQGRKKKRKKKGMIHRDLNLAKSFS